MLANGRSCVPSGLVSTQRERSDTVRNDRVTPSPVAAITGAVQLVPFYVCVGVNMSNPPLVRRVAVASASLVLALGAAGVAASAAFADAATPVAPASAQPSEAPDAPEAGDPTFTLTNHGAGSFSLAITIPGTSIAVDYTVDPTGAVTGATTSTAGASVAVDGHDLTVTLADGRAVKVELGDAGDAVEEVSVEAPKAAKTPEPKADESKNDDQSGDQAEQPEQHGDGAGKHGDHHGDHHGDRHAPAATPEPAATGGDNSGSDKSESGAGGGDGGSDSGSGSGSGD